MQSKISRREMVRSLPGITLGAGMVISPYGNLSDRNEVINFKPQINVPVSPPGPKSLSLLEELKKYIGRSNYTGLYGVGLKNGNGPFIEDVDGNVYLDCLTAASSSLLGYSRDDIAKSYYDSSVKIQQTSFPYTPNYETVEFAKKLCKIAPGSYEKKVLIGMSGSASVCGSIEAARKYSRKRGIISFNFAYHGSTGLSQAASGFRSLNEGIYDMDDPDFIKVPFPVTPFETESVLKNIESILAFGKTAAVLVEIIQGDSGTLIAPKGFFPGLKKMLDKYKVLLIDDEIQTGMGRTGKWWACEHEDIEPDITVIGKGLAAGYAPVSAIIGNREVLDALLPATHVFTFTGHGPSVSAALKTIEIIENENLIENSRLTGARLLNGLKAAEKYPDVIVEARGRGFMIGIEINIERDLLASKIFAYRCLEKGVYFGYIGDKQRVIRVLPPLNLNSDECDTVTSIVHETAEEMHRGKIPQTTIDKVHKYAVGW
jgi:4-aminobutyrate aminotransferase-like enzyme